jgi:hypothetical protein
MQNRLAKCWRDEDMCAHPVLSLSPGLKAPTIGRAAVIRLMVALSLLADLYLSLPVFAAESVCTKRVPDPVINGEAQVLIILLLDGQPSFYKKFDAEIAKLRSGPDPKADEPELIMDMHCMDPQDVKVGMAGQQFQYSIDGWRVKVNEAIGSLAYTNDIPATLAQVEKDVNQIADYDHALFVADFNRDARQAQQPFFARLRPDGSIEIIHAQ